MLSHLDLQPKLLLASKSRSGSEPAHVHYKTHQQSACSQSEMPDQSPAAQDQRLPYWHPVDESLLEGIYNADQAIYPAPLLTYERMRSWVTSCPDLSICLRKHDAAEGLIIVLPVVGEHWARLAAGELREHDVDPNRMFPSAGAAGGVDSRVDMVKVGLHVFHIERYPTGGRKPGFTPKALEEIRTRVGQRFPRWEIMGYSGMWNWPTITKPSMRHGTWEQAEKLTLQQYISQP